MRVTVKTTNLTLTPAIATFLAERIDAIAKLLARVERRSRQPEKTFPHAVAVGRIELGRTTRHHQKGNVFRAEMTLDVPGRKVLRAEATAEDVRVAINRMRDDIQREIRSWKGKKSSLMKKGARTFKQRIRGG